MINKKCKICTLLAGFFLASAGMSVNDRPAGDACLTDLLAVPAAEARYQSDSNTDADILDYIENNRRAARENALNADQKQLLQDAHKLRENLREPLDPTKNVPVAVEGEELFYDEANGDFIVDGNVVLTSLDQRRFMSDHADGNLQSQDVSIEGKSDMLQLTPAQARIILTGYKTQYNWGKQTGQMEDVNGKLDSKYVKASRIELYPDKVILFNAFMSKCGAKNPDYHMTADRVEYYPGVETISYNCKYWLGSIPVYSVAKQVTKENEKQQYMPKVTYSNSDGVGLRDTFYYPLLDRVNAYADIYLSTKQKFKNIYGIKYDTKGFGTFNFSTGFHEDSDGHFVHKAPNIRWDFSDRIGKTPYSYSLAYERGAWAQDDKHSMHTYYYGSISRDPFYIGTWRFWPTVNYSITQESMNDSDVRGFGWNFYGIRDFDDRWTAYAAYHYSQRNSKNSVFDFDLDDYSRKLSTGFSYRFSDKDRVVIGTSFDLHDNSLKDVDYYWYHDIHCAQVITRYRGKRQQWQVKFQFQPW